jgi:glutamine synthetase
LAGLTVAARYGFEMEGALDLATKTYADVDIHKETKKKGVEYKQLPASCWESAEQLSIHREIFEKHGVFNVELIDDFIKFLRSYNDAHIREEVENDHNKMLELVETYFHC